MKKVSIVILFVLIIFDMNLTKFNASDEFEEDIPSASSDKIVNYSKCDYCSIQNKKIYYYNDLVIDKIIPVYRTVTNAKSRSLIVNFFSNIREPLYALNNLFQFEFRKFLTNIKRFVINTTIGGLGMFDVASNINIGHADTNFEETFRKMKINSGPYGVLPIYGPSTPRNISGNLVDSFLDPINFILPAVPLFIIFLATKLSDIDSVYDSFKSIENTAIDPYSSIREIYMQKYYDDFNQNDRSKSGCLCD